MLRELEGKQVRVICEDGLQEGRLDGCDGKWNVLLRLKEGNSVIIRGDLVICIISINSTTPTLTS